MKTKQYATLTLDLTLDLCGPSGDLDPPVNGTDRGSWTEQGNLSDTRTHVKVVPVGRSESKRLRAWSHGATPVKGFTTVQRDAVARDRVNNATFNAFKQHRYM